MSQYPISKEFFPFTYLKPPMNEPFLKLAALGMKTPKFLYQDYLLDVQRYEVKSYDQEEIEVFVISPKNCDDLLPCLLYFHGGGFVLKAASYHYQNAMTYAKECHCKVVFVNYRLAPKYPFPTFLKDGYAAMEWLYQNAKQLKIDKKRIGIGGDSAGASIAAGVCMMAKVYHHPIQFSYQMLVYPFLDARNQSVSCQKYKDTPMWNTSLSHKIAKMVKANKNHPLYHYYSILEASCFQQLPPAYIETAQYDCLYDDGISYAKRLEKEGIKVYLNETKGTMHGFDIVQKASISKEAIKQRIKFMKEMHQK